MRPPAPRPPADGRGELRLRRGRGDRAQLPAGPNAAGGVYFSPAFLQERLKRHNAPGSFDKILSDREQAVLLALADCGDDRQVARQLDIAVATAEKHRFNLMRKLGLKSPAELLRYARAQGFAAGHLPD